MVRPQVHANDPPPSHQLLDAATPSNSAPARNLKRSAVPLGTRKRVRSDGDPAGADSILAAQPAGQTVASALLDSSSHHNAPSQPAAYPPASSIPLHHPVAADANNVFAMNPPTSAAQDFGGFGGPYGGMGWSQISSGFYDGNLTASIPQPPFPQSQTPYDDQFAVPQPPALTESFSPSPSAAALEGMTSLEKLSTGILRTLGQQSFQDVLDAVNKVGTPQGKEYAILKAHFDQQFKALSQQRPFLDAKALRLDSAPYFDMVRQVNMSAFVSSLFGGQEIPLPTLNECFLDIFVPAGGSLVEWQGSLWLELKTQAYAAALMKGRERREDVADRLLPLNIDIELQHGRPEPKQLSPVEQDFVDKTVQRRQALLSQQDTPEARIKLTRRYDWTSFLKELSGATAQILKIFNGSAGVAKDVQLSPFNGHFTQPGGFHSYPPISEAEGNNYDETITRAALVAHAALAPTQAKSSDGQQNAIPFYQAYPHVAQQHTSTQPVSKTASPGSPAPVQSAPTQVLYDQARAASSVRAPPNSRKGGGQNQRRPWSLDEERALMDGLDRVKGPHWSQILALYGAGGTVSEILKERNQVQLKDKARNLKLFFLKSGVEVPVYLQGVTGDLKTRAPAQAAKQEALAKQRLQEEQGKLQERRAQIDAAAVLAAGRWTVNGAPDPFVQQNPYAGRTATAIDPALRIAEDSGGQ
ncbi:telomere repeat binding factor-domain-containing protein [Phyllosticta citricarpa]